MWRNVPKKSEQIQRFKLKLPLNCWVFFDVVESTVEYCLDMWVKFSPFFIFLKNSHLAVAVRYPSRAFWDTFSDGQFLWFRDMTS